MNGGQTAVSSPDCSSSNHSQDGSSVTGSYFARYSESGSPFDVGVDEVQEEDILANTGVSRTQLSCVYSDLDFSFRRLDATCNTY